MDFSPNAWWRIANTLEDVEDSIGEVEFKVHLDDSRLLREARKMVETVRTRVERTASLAGLQLRLDGEPDR